MRFYYKAKEFNIYVSLKTPDFDNDSNYIKISEEEFNEYMKSIESEE